MENYSLVRVDPLLSKRSKGCFQLRIFLFNVCCKCGYGKLEQDVSSSFLCLGGLRLVVKHRLQPSCLIKSSCQSILKNLKTKKDWKALPSLKREQLLLLLDQESWKSRTHPIARIELKTTDHFNVISVQLPALSLVGALRLHLRRHMSRVRPRNIPSWKVVLSSQCNRLLEL